MVVGLFGYGDSRLGMLDTGTRWDDEYGMLNLRDQDCIRWGGLWTWSHTVAIMESRACIIVYKIIDSDLLEVQLRISSVEMTVGTSCVHLNSRYPRRFQLTI